jgi:hypothetical protein
VIEWHEGRCRTHAGALDDLSEATVSTCILGRRGPLSQTWRAFLDNRTKELIALDFITVPTTTFRVLFVLIVFVFVNQMYFSFLGHCVNPVVSEA